MLTEESIEGLRIEIDALVDKWVMDVGGEGTMALDAVTSMLFDKWDEQMSRRNSWNHRKNQLCILDTHGKVLCPDCGVYATEENVKDCGIDGLICLSCIKTGQESSNEA